MEKNHSITDEQIARFVAGTATEEERNAVLEYMSQSDENLEEVMAIAEAVQAQRAAATPAHKTSPLVWRIAASVAVILIAGGVWLALRDRGVDLVPQAGNTVAMNTAPEPSDDYAATAPNEPSPVATTPTMRRTPSSDLVADAEQQEEPLKPMQFEYPAAPERTADAQVAALQTAKNQKQSETLRPDTEHQVHVQMPESWTVGTDLVFTWGSTDKASGIMFSLRNVSSAFRPQPKLYTDDRVVIPAAEMEELILIKGDLEWTLQPRFDNENPIRTFPVQKGRIKVRFAE